MTPPASDGDREAFRPLGMGVIASGMKTVRHGLMQDPDFLRQRQKAQRRRIPREMPQSIYRRLLFPESSTAAAPSLESKSRVEHKQKYAVQPLPSFNVSEEGVS